MRIEYLAFIILLLYEIQSLPTHNLRVPYQVLDRIFVAYFRDKKHDALLPEMFSSRYYNLKQMLAEPKLIYKNESNIKEASRFCGAFKLSSETSAEQVVVQLNKLATGSGTVIQPADLVRWSYESKESLADIFKAAVKNIQVEIVRHLLPLVDVCLLKWIFESSNPELIQEMLKWPHFDPNFELVYSVKAGVDRNLVENLIVLIQDSRIDKSLYTNFLIRWSSQFGHIEMVKILLKVPIVDPSVPFSHM